jgi:hypothetical protein
MAQRVFRKSEGDIAFDDDIILNVAEKYGFDVKHVALVFGFLFPYIKRETRKPTVLSFRVPNMGYMTFKVERARHIYAAMKKYSETNPVTKAYKTKVLNLGEQIENFYSRFRKIRDENPDKYILCRTRFNNILTLPSYRRGMTLEEYEGYINKL